MQEHYAAEGKEAVTSKPQEDINKRVQEHLMRLDDAIKTYRETLWAITVTNKTTISTCTFKSTSDAYIYGASATLVDIEQTWWSLNSLLYDYHDLFNKIKSKRSKKIQQLLNLACTIQFHREAIETFEERLGVIEKRKILELLHPCRCKAILPAQEQASKHGD